MADETLKKKRKPHGRLLMIMLTIAVAMFGFGYLLVPLYNVMCKQLGINGKTAGRVEYDTATAVIDKNRTVTVEFLASNNANLPWAFYPLVKKIDLHPGEMKRVAFFAENTTDNAMTVQAVPSVSPGEAAKYLKKTECFCFTQQTLKPHEARDMPLIFHLDPHLPKEIQTLTLSYTLFDVGGLRKNTRKHQGRIN